MTTVKGLLVTPDGEHRVVEVGDDLDTLQRIVGGPIEYVFVTYGVHAYIHEEGKFEGLPPNPAATRLCGLEGVDIIVGSAIFLGEKPDGEEGDLPPEWLSRFSV